jgi:hypothetical protein
MRLLANCIVILATFALMAAMAAAVTALDLGLLGLIAWLACALPLSIAMTAMIHRLNT